MKIFFPYLLFFILLSGLFFSCKKLSPWEYAERNKPPTAIAGSDQVITLPTDSILLDGSASNDPDGAIRSYTWRRIEGPVSFTIINPSTANAKVKNLVEGVYLFELKITGDKGLSATDTIQVTVNSVTPANHPPVANAGNDTTITLPANTINLDGNRSTDPDNNITGYQWIKISGPSSFNIANADAVQTEVTNLIEGSYRFELKVTDAGGLTGRDTVQVIVQALTDESGIYAAGNNHDVVSGINSPFYWHNGTRTNLSTGGYAESVFVSGTDVYVAGTSGGKPGYWKNGLRTDLLISSSSLEGGAHSIFVSGTDIYVAGYTSNPSAFPGYAWPYTPCYWKNGVRTDLSPILGTTSSIFVSGADLYIAGDSLTSDYHTPGYWKNGQRINLSNGGDATSIFVSGTDVYVAGGSYNASSLTDTPCYWKNGQRRDIPGNGALRSIFIK